MEIREKLLLRDLVTFNNHSSKEIKILNPYDFFEELMEGSGITQNLKCNSFHSENI